MNYQQPMQSPQQPMRPMPPQGKQCKHCKQFINPAAKVCPYCRKSQSSGCLLAFLITFLIVIALVFFLIVSGALSSFMDGYNGASKRTEVKKQAQMYSESDYKALCKSVTFEEILRDKNALESQKLTFTGRIVQVQDDFCRMDITKTSWGYKDTILFTYDPDSLSENILEHDIVTIWGESSGLYTYKALLGQEVTVPRIEAIYLENNGQEKE